MKLVIRASSIAVTFAVGALSLAAAAQTTGTSKSSIRDAKQTMAISSGATMSPKERGQLTRNFVRKWGLYVQRTYGVPVRVWAMRMVPDFAKVDANNLRSAMKRTTFEGAMAQLNGSGSRTSDSAVITQLAKTSDGVGINALGSLVSDLVFTPLTPCRILDTRNTPAGPIPRNTSRDFVAVNQANFSSQGGSATDCGTNGGNVSAVVMQLTAVMPLARGFATVYPYKFIRPFAASVNFSAGENFNNTVGVQLPNPLDTFDFTIYTNNQADYVADIVGYFAAPEATALDCTSTFVSESVAANEFFDITIPACPGGYTVTGAGCRTPGFNDADWAINGLFRSGPSVNTFCSGVNKLASTITVEGTAQCCRVPGR